MTAVPSKTPWAWRALTVVGLALILYGLALPARAQNQPPGPGGPIVPCGIRSLNQPNCTLCHFGILTINLTNFLIYYIALPASVVLVAVSGVILLTAGPSEARLTLGKSILWSALWGAIIVFLAWLMVDTTIKVLTGQNQFRGTEVGGWFGPWHTLNPANCPLSGPRAGPSGQTVAPSGAAPATGGPSASLAPTPTTPAAGKICPGCVPLANSSLAVKPGICNGQQCYINPTLQLRLVQLNGNVSGWQITEAWPATANVTHQNPCHAAGTCVDTNFINSSHNFNSQVINNYITQAKAAGLKAVYEVKSVTRQNQLLNAGLPLTSVQVVPTATAEHFSVYML